jgi:uncharacterized membrane protein (DUF2068 family)
MAAGDGMLRLIGLFKLAKATVLVAVGAAGLAEVPRELARRLHRGVAWLGLFPGHAAFDLLLTRLLSLNPRTEHVISLLLLSYALVFLVEGWGLTSGKRWAEWMTVCVTGSFVPVEAYEIAHHFTPGRVGALIVNLAIVAYLIGRRVERRVSARRLEPPARGDAEREATEAASRPSRSRGP